MKANSRTDVGATYRVTVRETLQRVLEIEALSAEIALETVKGLYQQEVVVLDYADFVEAEISLKALECRQVI
ncbi:MAG: DpnD/PcfM family protein [Bacteroidota bacterium]